MLSLIYSSSSGIYQYSRYSCFYLINKLFYLLLWLTGKLRNDINICYENICDETSTPMKFKAYKITKWKKAYFIYNMA